jgi:hypothetical protein
MPTEWKDIEIAYLFADVDGNEAFVSKTTGKTYLRSPDFDAEGVPDDIDGDGYVALPNRRDLDLGGRLVERFAAEVLPQHADKIGNIFSGKGAYGRFKNYLDRVGELKRWFEFEDAETKKALRAWCAENGIEIED